MAGCQAETDGNGKIVCPSNCPKYIEGLCTKPLETTLLKFEARKVASEVGLRGGAIPVLTYFFLESLNQASVIESSLRPTEDEALSHLI